MPAGITSGISPAECIGAWKTQIEGHPDPDHVSASYVEHQNHTTRMPMRSFTRPTNTFSKKVENHAYAVTLHFISNNVGRIHKSPHVRVPGQGR